MSQHSQLAPVTRREMDQEVDIFDQMREWASVEVQANPNDYMNCGEMNCTTLGEEIADQFDGSGPDDCIEELAFEVAAIIAELYENNLS